MNSMPCLAFIGQLSMIMNSFTDISADLKRINGLRPQMTEELRSWCAINSGSFNLIGLEETRLVLAEAFSRLDADIVLVDSEDHTLVKSDGTVVERKVGGCLQIVKRPQAPIRILLSGHMDTVFPSDSEFLSDRMLDQDTMNAPGSADMKGGLLVMLTALETIEHSSLADKIGYEVIINADEEIGSHGSLGLIKSAAERAQFACVYEPALPDGTLAGARKGSGNFSVIFSGRTAHAGRDHHLGRNALVAAAEFMVAVSGLSGARNGLTVNVAKVDGGGPNNVVPDNAVVRFNVRVEEPDDATWFATSLDAMLADLRKRDGIGVQLHGGFGRPPKPMTPQLKSFFEALKKVGHDLGIKIGWQATGGCCDGNNIAAAGIPVIDTLGVRGANIHSSSEIIKLDSLEERARLSAALMLHIAAGNIPNPGIEAMDGR